MKMECCSVLVVSLLFHRNIPSSLWPPCFGLWRVCSVDDTKGGDWAGRVKEREFCLLVATILVSFLCGF